MGLVNSTPIISSLTNRRKFRFSLNDGFVILFIGNVFISTFIFNDHSANTAKPVILALLLVLYLSVRLIFDNNRQAIQFLCFFIILTGLVEAVLGLMQIYGFLPSRHSLFKLTGSFLNPGPYAGYLAVIIPLALYGSLSNTSKGNLSCPSNTHGTSKKGIMVVFTAMTKRIVAVTTCIAIGLVLPASMSRASWLAAIAGCMVVLVGNRNKTLRFNGLLRRFLPAIDRRHAFSFPAFRRQDAVTTILKGVTAHPTVNRIKKGFIIFASISVILLIVAGLYYLKKDSSDGRLLMWKVSLSAVIKHPLGVGLGHFSHAYGEAQAAYFASGRASATEAYVAGNPEYGFNEFLQIGIESGIFVLILFIGLIICAFRGLMKSGNWGAMGSLTSLLVFACFSYPFSVLPFLIVFVFLLAIAGGAQMTGLRASSRNDALISTDFFSVRRVYVVIGCLIVTGFCFWQEYPVYGAYRQWKRNQMYYQLGMYKETAQNYETLYPYLNDRINFLFEYGRSLSQTERFEESNRVLQHATQISCDPMLYNIMGKNYQAMGDYDSAEKCLRKSALIVPNRIYPYYLLMKLHIETGDKEKALENAEIVLTKEPKVQSTAVREMREEAKKWIASPHHSSHDDDKN